MLIAFFSPVAMLLGFFMELLVGWRLPWHPIMGIGSVISSAEEAIRGALPKTKAGERFGGALLVLTVIFISVVLPFAVPVSYTHLDVYKRQVCERAVLCGGGILLVKKTVYPGITFALGMSERVLYFE